MSDRRFPGIGDPALLGLQMLLALLGIAMIYSAGQVEVPSVATGIWTRQLVWLGMALVAFAVATRVPTRWLEWFAPWLYVFAIGSLVLVLIIGTGPNTRSWFQIGPARLQPAEVAKLATILMIARLLSGKDQDFAGLSRLWKPVALVLVPFALVLLQPDLGSAVIFGVILIAALFWVGVPLIKIFLLVSPAVSLLLGFNWVVWGAWFIIIVVFLYFHRPFILESISVMLANFTAGALTVPLWDSLATYQQNRLLVFLDPEIDARGAGWHLIQSKVAIGSGGLFGQGFARGPQKRLAFLPEQHTDFLGSVIGEELGFVGVVFFLALFGLLLWRLLRIAVAATDDFGSTMVFCLSAIIFAHLIVNLGMTVGLMPITGLPLPLLSYGGSFLLLLFTGLGITQRVAAQR
jgi:rod shape determining protein RodA